MASSPTTSRPSPAAAPERVTRQQVTEICGTLDDMKIATIIGTGASAAELMEAKVWLASDDYLGGDLERSPTGRVAQLVELLRADETDWDADRDGP